MYWQKDIETMSRKDQATVGTAETNHRISRTTPFTIRY